MKVVTINSSVNKWIVGTNYTKNESTDFKPLNLNPSTWLNTRFLVKKGIFTYPAEVKEWTSIKALEKAKLITISNEFEGEPDDPNSIEASEAKKKADVMEKEEKETNKKKQMRKAKLDELADKAVEKQYEEALKE